MWCGFRLGLGLGLDYLMLEGGLVLIYPDRCAELEWDPATRFDVDDCLDETNLRRSEPRVQLGVSYPTQPPTWEILPSQNQILFNF